MLSGEGCCSEHPASPAAIGEVCQLSGCRCLRKRVPLDGNSYQEGSRVRRELVEGLVHFQCCLPSQGNLQLEGGGGDELGVDLVKRHRGFEGLDDLALELLQHPGEQSRQLGVGLVDASPAPVAWPCDPSADRASGARP